MTARPVVPPAWRLERRGLEDAELRLSGDWIARETGLRDAAAVRQVLAMAGGAARLRLETGGLGRWDSALVAFLQALRRAATEAAAAGLERRIELDETGLPEAARRLLALAAESGPAPPAATPPAADSLLTRTGRRATARWAEVVAIATLVGETVLSAAAALGGRVRTRAADVLELMREAGAAALAIVAIVNGLIGGILAFVGAVQLRRFGAEIYVADLVGIAMVREMAAVMTAIVMAGRTGGAYAAQIATMQGNEEIDALKTFGIPVHRLPGAAADPGAGRHDAAALPLRLRGRPARRPRSSAWRRSTSPPQPTSRRRGRPSPARSSRSG